MPRKARELANSKIYHVMTRTFPGGKLFYNDTDKAVMLRILKKMMIELGFEVYAYCLMDNHTHFLFNTKNANISEIMKKFNLRYGAYLRGTGKHRGPIFRGRFNSKPVENDRYLIQVSKYIHQNPIDIKKYKNKPEKYKYSSLGIYLGLKDEFGVCNFSYIMKLLGDNVKEAREVYYKAIFVKDADNLKEAEFKIGNNQYINDKVLLIRELSIIDVEEYVCEKFKINKQLLRVKYFRDYSDYKAIFILLLTRFLGKKNKDIAHIIGNISSSNISRLCKVAINLVIREESFKYLIEEFISKNSVVDNF